MPLAALPPPSIVRTAGRSLVGVARKEVLVHLDDELVARLDELAADRNMTRDEFLRYAITRIDTKAELEEIYRRMADAAATHPDEWEWDDEYAREGATRGTVG